MNIFQNKKSFSLGINDFHEIDNKNYYKEVIEIFDQAKEIFPYLEIKMLPLQKNTEIFIQGWLIKKDFIDKLGYLLENIENECIYVLVRIKEDISDIIVYDFYNMINDKNIPIEYRHFRPEEKFENGLCKPICTHFCEEFKLSIYENRLIEVLESAWRLIRAYKEFERTGKYPLQSYSHGKEKAMIEFKKRWKSKKYG